LGDVVTVITRYFGGTKLGTGGLVRAYSESMRLVVEAVPRGEKVQTHTVMLAFAYTYLERIRLLVVAQAGEILDEEFAADVTMTARMRVERLSAFQETLAELTKGQVRAEVISSEEVLVAITP
jgi:putative IMPACT (imprinted ancient) family translation regulator